MLSQSRTGLDVLMERSAASLYLVHLTFQNTFTQIIFFIIEMWLIYNIMLVSGVFHSDLTFANIAERSPW